jgi:hypothetical protein
MLTTACSAGVDDRRGLGEKTEATHGFELRSLRFRFTLITSQSVCAADAGICRGEAPKTADTNITIAWHFVTVEITKERGGEKVWSGVTSNSRSAPNPTKSGGISVTHWTELRAYRIKKDARQGFIPNASGRPLHNKTAEFNIAGAAKTVLPGLANTERSCSYVAADGESSSNVVDSEGRIHLYISAISQCLLHCPTSSASSTSGSKPTNPLSTQHRVL